MIDPSSSEEESDDEQTSVSSITLLSMAKYALIEHINVQPTV